MMPNREKIEVVAPGARAASPSITRGAASARDGEHRRGDVDAGDVAAERAQAQRRRAAAAADVEHALADLR